MSKAQTDIRRTSYNATTANPYGYQGTIDDAIAQIRAEPNEVRAYWPFNISRERHELLSFLGVHKPKSELSGRQKFTPMPAPARRAGRSISPKLSAERLSPTI